MKLVPQPIALVPQRQSHVSISLDLDGVQGSTGECKAEDKAPTTKRILLKPRGSGSPGLTLTTGIPHVPPYSVALQSARVSTTMPPVLMRVSSGQQLQQQQ